MKKFQTYAIISLLLLICSGIYGIIIGIYSTNEYIRLTKDLRNQAGASLTVGSLIFDYLLGSSRGIATLVCGFCGIAGIRKGTIKAWNFTLLGILTLLYILGLIEYPYVEEFAQMLIAIICLLMLGICKFAEIKYAA